MKARIKKIDYPRASRNGDVYFRRVHFVLQDGSYAMTDLVSSYRNFPRWQEIINSGPGTYIGGVELKSNSKVDADSDVYIIQKPLIKSNLPPARDPVSPDPEEVQNKLF